jgi:hypothetical protein
MPEFRIEPGLLYVDESGLLQAPQGRPSEIGTLGGLLMPDHRREHEALASLLRDIRKNMFGDANSRREIKAKKLGPGNYKLIADVVRQRWVVGYPSLAYTTPDLEDLRQTFKVLLEGEGLGRERLGPVKAMDLRLDFLTRQFEKDSVTFPVYMALLFKLYRDIAQWFRKNQILPKLTVWLDDKIPRAHTELLEFLGRFSIYTEFPEVFSNRLGELLGVDPSPFFTCRVGSDADLDGLVVADAIAYAARRVARGKYKDLFFKKILDRMNTDVPLQSIGPGAS